MGRFYSGDIEGKFWFAVQSSDDASFFGGEEIEPNYIAYFFDEEDLPDIRKGIKICLKKLGKNKKLLDKFFKSNSMYNDEALIKAGLKKSEIYEALEWYARLDLGEKILKCVKEQGTCEFEAEL